MNQPVRHLQNQWAGRYYQFATRSGFRYRWPVTQSCEPFAGSFVAIRPCRIVARGEQGEKSLDRHAFACKPVGDEGLRGTINSLGNELCPS